MSMMMEIPPSLDAADTVPARQRTKSASDIDEDPFPLRSLLAIGMLVGVLNGISVLPLSSLSEKVLISVVLFSLGLLSFFVCGKILKRCGYSNLGNAVVERVSNALANWQSDFLRSAIETYVFLGTMCLAYVIWHNVFVAVELGAIAGVCSCAVCEMFLNEIRNMEIAAQQVANDDQQKERLAPMLFSFGYVVTYVCNLIYAYGHDIGVAISIAMLAGLSFVMAAHLFSKWEPTRAVGTVLLKRVTEAHINWRQHFVRSFVETSCWLGVIFASYAMFQDLPTAIQQGTLTGVIVSLTSEYTANTLIHPSRTTQSSCTSCSYMGSSFVFICTGVGALHWIFHPIFSMQSSLPLTSCMFFTIVAGIAFTLAVECFQCFRPINAISRTLHARLTHAIHNWRQHTLRSLFEVSCWLGTTALSFCFITMDHHFPLLMRNMPLLKHVVIDLYPVCTVVALVTGALAGVTAVLVTEITLQKKEKEALRQTAAEAATTKKKKKKPKSVATKEQGREQGKEHEPSMSPAEAMPAMSLSPSPSSGKAKAKAEASEKKKKQNELPVISLDELAKHNSSDDLWLAVHGTVYDVSKWHAYHPGGAILLKYGGTECSDEFECFHRARVLKRLQRLRKVATLGQTCAGNELPCSVEYRALRRRLWEEGYFEADTAAFGYFWWKHVVVALFAAAVAACFALPSLFASAWVRLLVAPTLLGLVWQQAAFLAHDALHNGVLVPADGGGFNLLGWIHGTLIFGISSAKWLYEHNLHHSMTLRPCEDPQFDYLPMWLQSVKEIPLFKAGKAKVPHCWLQVKLCRLLIPFQHITILPLCVVAGRFNYYAESLEFALRTRAWMDLLGMSVYWAWFAGLLCLLPSASERLVFTLVSHCAIGVLHVQLLVSHLCTQNYTPEEQAELGFFQFQLLTTRNIDSQWWAHWFHGGLELQIEHHLFPQLPRHALSSVKPMVRALCERHSVPYVSVGFFEAIGICLRDLEALGKELATIDLN